MLKRNIKKQSLINGHLLYDSKALKLDSLMKPQPSSIEKHKSPYPPDNSFEEVNLFVKGFDKEWNFGELSSYFSKYGEIKSAKISLNPKTS